MPDATPKTYGGAGQHEYRYTLNDLRAAAYTTLRKGTTATWSAYHTVFNPSVVLSLLDRITELEGYNERLRATVARHEADWDRLREAQRVADTLFPPGRTNQ